MNSTRSKAQRFYRARPFVALSQRKRRELHVRLRWKIRCEAPLYGGRFTSRLIMEEVRPELYNQWFDFYFLGRDRFTIWNASICTARLAFWDAVSELALDRTFAKLTPEECEEENKFEREFSCYKNGQRYYTLKKNPERTYDKLNGLSFREYWEKLENEIARNEPPVIYESFRVDTSFRYGIGLYIVVEAGSINRMVIEQAIDRFYEIGEKKWQAEEPVPREKLPYESERESLARIDYPSVLLGQQIRGAR
jgi:hypothetical protein